MRRCVARRRNRRSRSVGVARGAPHPAQDGGGTHPPIGPFALGVVRLVFVVREEPVVDGLRLAPGRSTGVVVVGHVAHDVDVGLDVVLLGLPGPDLLLPALPDPEGRADRLGLLGSEGAPARADRALGRAVGLYRRPQDNRGNEVGGKGPDEARRRWRAAPGGSSPRSRSPTRTPDESGMDYGLLGGWWSMMAALVRRSKGLFSARRPPTR